MGGAYFGGRSVASFLHKVTIGLASAFLVISLILGSQIFKSQREAYDESLTQRARTQRKVSSSSAQIPTVPGAFENEGKQATESAEESQGGSSEAQEENK